MSTHVRSSIYSRWNMQMTFSGQIDWHDKLGMNYCISRGNQGYFSMKEFSAWYIEWNSKPTYIIEITWDRKYLNRKYPGILFFLPILNFDCLQTKTFATILGKIVNYVRPGLRSKSFDNLWKIFWKSYLWKLKACIISQHDNSKP